MGKLSRFLFIGGMTALLTSSAWANLYFSVPHVGRGDNRYIEVGATATIQVLYDNDTAADVNIDAVKLYLEYTASIINQASVRINNNNGSSLTDQKNDTTIAGKIDFEARNMPGQTLLAVPSGRTGVVLATVTFRVNQWDLLVGEEDYFIRFTAVDTNNNVQVVDSGANVSGSRINPIDDVATALHLEATHVPNFNGLNSATDTHVGNTVNLDWAVNEGLANDRGANADTQYRIGTRLRYNIYRSETNGTRGALIAEASGLNATSYTNGPRTSIPGVGDQSLSDGTTYYFNVCGQDDCLPTRNLETNSTQVAVTPHDYTAPGVPLTPILVSGDGRIFLDWTNPVDLDFGGVVVLRKVGRFPTPTFEGAAEDENGTPNPTTLRVGSPPPGDSDATVVYVGRNKTLGPDGDFPLENGTKYFYSIYAYDRIAEEPREQGYNWSVPVERFCTPGVAPTALQNFVALSTPSGIVLRWNTPPETFYGGALIVGTTDVRDWARLTKDAYRSIPEGIENSDAIKLVLNEVAPESSAPGDSVQVPLSSFGGQPFDLTGETVYYFQGFAYNRGEVLATDNADSIAAHQFSSGSLAGATLVPSSGEGVVVAATVTPITYRFQPVSGGVNLNDFAVLTVPLRVANVAGTSAMDSVNTIGGFVTAVNAVAGSSVITTIGWLENGKIVGYYITYSDTGVPVYTPTTGAGADPSRVELVRGKAYQIGVSAAVTVTLSAAPASE